MNNNFIPEKIPQGSVLGVNYSGMHDTAIALVSPQGTPLFAISLERISRVKQDGRLPDSLLEGFPWERITKVAISVEREYIPAKDLSSKFHPLQLTSPFEGNKSHADSFLQALDFIPVEKVFIPHHLSHAASAFWLSGFASATCLIYDGGMSNENWFGGLFSASDNNGIVPIDQFSSFNCSNITNLYTAITAALGFSPLKHEGKITGLAAYGTVTKSCRKILEQWLNEPEILHDILEWKDMYSSKTAPQLKPVPSSMQIIRNKLASHTREDIAATVQKIAEEHVLAILNEVISQGEALDNLCLSGGLFANVKINQRASELGFKKVFVSPPMADDGSALGAALQAVSEHSDFTPKPVHSMFLGPSYSKSYVSNIISEKKIKYHEPDDPASEIAKLLKNNTTVAIFQGEMEFGPRALGNRSILTNANDTSINQLLNERLSRTEFMPFAPVCLEEDADILFKDIESVRHSAEFMTVTVNCTDEMKSLCPAVVHIDGTARPQLVSQKFNPFMHQILFHYKKLSGKPALVNTSFNIHEEPIVCTPDDAIKGFFESGLDALFIEGHLIKLSENQYVEAEYLRKKIKHIHSILSTERNNVEQLNISLGKNNEALAGNEAVLAEQLVHSQWLKNEWDAADILLKEHISELSSVKTNAEHLYTQLDDKSKALAASEATLAEQLAHSQQLQIERDTANALLKERISELSTVKTKAEHLNAQLNEKSNALTVSDTALTEQQTHSQWLKNKWEAANASLEEHISELSSVKNNAEHLCSQLDDKSKALAASETTLTEQLAHSQQLQNERDTANEALTCSEVALAELHAHSHWLKNEWDAEKSKIEELNQSSHHWWTAADGLSHELQSVYNSKSWRITWPLRKLMQLSKWLTSLPIRLSLWVLRLPKRTARWLLVKAMPYVLKHPELKIRAMARLNNHPKLKEKLRRLMEARGLVVTHAATPTQTHPELAVNNNDSTGLEPEILNLTPSAHRIYRELKTAIALHEQKRL